MTTNEPSTADAATTLITELAKQGHSHGYIATALNRANIPTPSGRGQWARSAVWNIAKKAGVKVQYGARYT